MIDGTIVNTAAVIGGSIAGMFFSSKLPERGVKITFQAIGCFTLFLGFAMALKAENYLVLVFSLVLGALTGEFLRIDKRIDAFSEFIKKKLKMGNEKFSEGFITSFLLFCVGSMTILGAVEEGLNGSSEILYTKSLMDGFSSLALASAFGSGVLFSSIPLFIFQGGLTILVIMFGNFATDAIINALTASGGILLIGLGINVLEIKNIKVINMLPALVFSIVLAYFFG